MISQISPTCSPNEREVKAARLAMSLARSFHFDRFILEGDSKVVVHVLQNPNSVRDWRISYVILDSLDTIPPASFWKVRKINRSANFCADLVTR
jgi:ribonuclease HI